MTVINGVPATGGAASYVFATSDALPSDKAHANYVLTGTADDVAVSAALTAGYKVIVFFRPVQEKRDKSHAWRIACIV